MPAPGSGQGAPPGHGRHGRAIVRGSGKPAPSPGRPGRRGDPA